MNNYKLYELSFTEQPKIIVNEWVSSPVFYANRLYYSDKNGVYSMLLNGTEKRKEFDDSLPYMKFIYKDFIFSYTPINAENAINPQDIIYEFSSTGPLTVNNIKRVYEFPE